VVGGQGGGPKECARGPTGCAAGTAISAADVLSKPLFFSLCSPDKWCLRCCAAFRLRASQLKRMSCCAPTAMIVCAVQWLWASNAVFLQLEPAMIATFSGGVLSPVQQSLTAKLSPGCVSPGRVWRWCIPTPC
jgi:hypothetical protein